MNAIQLPPLSALPPDSGHSEPRFGEKGFGLGKPKNQPGSPRARVTELDLRAVYFLAKFPATDAETLRMVTTAHTIQGQDLGVLPSAGSVRKRLRKLASMGYVESYRNRLTGIHHWGATPAGFELIEAETAELLPRRGLKGLSISRLNHYRMIGVVAARFASPIGFMREPLGIEPVKLSELISENTMRRDFETIKKQFKINRETSNGQPQNLPDWRTRTIGGLQRALTQGKIQPHQIIEFAPGLLTIGHDNTEGTNLKPVMQPDLALNLDASRTDTTAKNVLIEVELSQKSPEAYDAILQTLARELADPFVYSRAVYFTPRKGIANLLKRIDTAKGYNLISSGKLAVLPILDSNDQPLIIRNRVTF